MRIRFFYSMLLLSTLISCRKDSVDCYECELDSVKSEHCLDEYESRFSLKLAIEALELSGHECRKK